MLVKMIVDEDFLNYHKPSMFIGTCFCNWKCCIESNIPVTTCQNEPLSKQPNIEINNQTIVNRYLKNPITTAIVFGGLEPLLQFKELIELIQCFRKYTKDDIVIYTGYYPEEISSYIKILKQFPNIIIKFGRYKPNSQNKFDELLKINLISDNQFAQKIS